MKRILLIVSGFLLTATSTLFSQTPYDKIKELIDQKRPGEALTLCQTYLQGKPKDEVGWLWLAKAYQAVGNLDSTEIAALRAIQLDDELLDAYVVLGQVQLDRKNWQDANATARAGLKKVGWKKPKYPPLLVVLGQSLIGADSADAALVTAGEAKELDPKDPVAYEVMGDAYGKQGVAMMAITSYEKSLEIDSLQTRVLYKLANTYRKDRQYTEAARIYARILVLDPKNNAARLELGRLFFLAKQYMNCARTLVEYFKTEKNPAKDVQMMYLEALIYSRQYKEASAIAEDVVKREPNSPLALRALALGYGAEKQYAKSIEMYKKLAAVDTMQFDDYRWLGAAYKQLRKDTLAALTWEEALKDTTQPLQLRSYLLGEVGTIWMSMKSWERAAGYFKKRTQIDNTAVGAAINYALCMIQLERYEDAIAALKQAIKENPNYPPAYVNLGFCYFQMKDFDSGRKEFEEAIKVIDTAEIRYRLELADSYRMIGLSIMLEKKSTPEASQKKWEDAGVVLKKSLRYKEDVAQTHLLLGQCYQNLNKKEEAIRDYKRTLQLDSKNEQAKKGLSDLQPQ